MRRGATLKLAIASALAGALSFSILAFSGCNSEPEPAFLPEPADHGEAEEHNAGQGDEGAAAAAKARAAALARARAAAAENRPQRPQLEPIPAPADVAAPPVDAERTASGLASKVIEAGSGGDHPQATSRVRVHYTGWTTDGNMFDSSVARGAPATFPLNRVIAGWTEGVQLMVVGEKRRFWIPESLAYQGRPGAPAGMLVFDVELLEIL